MADSTNTLELIRAQVPVVQEQIKNASETIAGNAKKAEEAAAEAKRLYEQSAIDQAAITRQVQTDKMRIEQANRKAAETAGITDKGNRVLDLIGQFQTVGKEAITTLQTVRKKEELNFFSDPLQYIKNQFTIDDDKKKLEGAVTEMELVNKTLVQTTGQLGEAFKTNNAVTNSVTQATIEQSSRVAATEAQIRAQQAAIEGLRHNNEAVIAAKSGSQEGLAVLYNQRNAEMSEQQHKFALENFAAMQEQRSFERQMRQDAVEAKAVGKYVDDITLSKINTGRQVLGLPEWNALEAKAQLEIYKKGNSPILQEYYTIGEKRQVTGVSIYGNSPANALSTLDSLPANLPDTILETGKFLAKLRADATSVGAFKLIDPKDKKKQEEYVNNYIQEQMVFAGRSIVPGSGNPLDVGDLSTYIGTSKNPGITQLQSLRFVREVLSPAIAAGTPLDNPATVLSLGLAAASKGLLTTSEVAAGIASTYQRANLVNQTARNLLGFGIVLPANGMSYNAKVGNWGDTMDMTSYTQVGTYINRELAAKQDNPFGPRANEIRQAEKLLKQGM